MVTVSTPPALHRRAIDVDAIRGFALLGIFAVNVTFMASGYPGNLTVDPGFDSTTDNVVRALSSIFIDMKFYLLFSFLFGYSFTLQMDSASRAGAAFSARTLRRILGLFTIGALHTVFLYGGDVLTTYAVACLVLFLLRNVRDVTALRIAGVLYAVVLLSLILGAFLVDRSAFLPGEAEAQTNAVRATEAMLGGWSAHINGNLDGLPLLVVQALTMQGPTALAMFLLGLVAGHRQWLIRVNGTEPILRRIQWIGFPVGLAGSLAYTPGGGNGVSLAVAASVATAPFLTAAYVATLLRVMHHPRTTAIRTALAPAGRMALTNYLTQSVVGVLVFTGIGLGLAGTFSPLALMGLVAATFVGQMVVSARWLNWFRYGPAEWMLRWLTNAQRPAVRARPGGADTVS